MKAEKTIVCKITEPNKEKLKAIKEEYNKAQRYIKGETTDLYSATKQAMDKYIDIDKVKEGREYPLHLRNDTFEVEKAEDTKEFGYWARIPVANTYGKIIVPIYSSSRNKGRIRHKG